MTTRNFGGTAWLDSLLENRGAIDSDEVISWQTARMAALL
jgi:hypothetical protein